MTFRHECGGHAHCTSSVVVPGWNQCLCGRCGELFYKWFTVKMLQEDNDK